MMVPLREMTRQQNRACGNLGHRPGFDDLPDLQQTHPVILVRHPEAKIFQNGIRVLAGLRGNTPVSAALPAARRPARIIARGSKATSPPRGLRLLPVPLRQWRVRRRMDSRALKAGASQGSPQPVEGQPTARGRGLHRTCRFSVLFPARLFPYLCKIHGRSPHSCSSSSSRNASIIAASSLPRPWQTPQATRL